ncbi:MAG: 4Fe-4S double cluster binding domain-containing protein [Candidatus Methanofastidiosia archaeon]
MSSKMKPDILSQLKDHGYEGRIISTAHLQDMKKELEEHHKKGVIAEEIYRGDISQFTFEPPDNLAEAMSLIVVAVPQPLIRVVFCWKKKEVPATIPPTYLSVAKARNTVERILNEISHGEYTFVEASLPEKLVAAHSGLAVYGRNNITYVSGMGSFYNPLVFYSDLPGDDSWQNLQIMDPCQTCSVCLKRCPTHAITSERFLIKAERCLTLHNEKPGKIPFPEWVDPSWHTCLVGCMQCQYFCPENKNVVNWVEKGPVFSGEETTMLLQGFPLEELPSETVQKLTSIEMEKLLDVIPRNLEVLLPLTP